MSKVSLGTHYTPLGSHPDLLERETDLTPGWLSWGQLIALMVFLILSLRNNVANSWQSHNFYSMLFGVTFGGTFLTRAVFNRRQGVKYHDLVLATLLIGSGLYFFFKP